MTGAPWSNWVNTSHRNKADTGQGCITIFIKWCPIGLFALALCCVTVLCWSRRPSQGFTDFANECSPFLNLINAVVGPHRGGNRGTVKQLKSPSHCRSWTWFHLKGDEVYCYCTIQVFPLKSACERHVSLPCLHSGSGVPTQASPQLLFMTLALCIIWSKYRITS